MKLVISDPVTLMQLRDARTTVELVDSEGKVLGRFIPADDPADCDAIVVSSRDLQAAIAAEPPITEEELRRREQEPGRRLADILADLERRYGK
jgi:hypothetical protein